MERECFVYVISSEGRPYVYTGLTYDIQRRLAQHNSGHNRTTAPYRPFKLTLSERFPSRALAREREVFLKSGKGREWVHNLLEVDDLRPAEEGRN